MLVNHRTAVAFRYVHDFDHRFGGDGCRFVANGGCESSRHQMPTDWKRMANTASARITIVMDDTTEVVVPSPRLCEFALIRKPKWHAASAISMPNTTPLPSPIHRLAIGTTEGSERAKKDRSIPNTSFAASAPPSSETMLVHMTCMASSSSVTRITPICAVMAEPERPATRMAESTGPSSRITESPRIFTMYWFAPNMRSCCADR